LGNALASNGALRHGARLSTLRNRAALRSQRWARAMEIEKSQDP
jgi:hypothetical protein